MSAAEHMEHEAGDVAIFDPPMRAIAEVAHIKEALPMFEAAFAAEARQQSNRASASAAQLATVARIGACAVPVEGSLFTYQLTEDDLIVIPAQAKHEVGIHTEWRRVHQHFPIGSEQSGLWVVASSIRCNAHVPPSGQESRAYLTIQDHDARPSYIMVALAADALSEVVITDEIPDSCMQFDSRQYKSAQPPLYVIHA